MSFDLGFWHEDRPITADQAGEKYVELCDGNDRIVNAYPVVYFLEELEQRYPPIGAYEDDNIDDCPWNCDWDVGQGSVVVSIAWSRADELTPILVKLAHRHELLCYNPQRSEVYLPEPLLSDHT